MPRYLICLLLFSAPAPAAPIGEPLPPWTEGTLDIHQISTGRGNAALIIFPDGTSLLVDAGEVTAPIPFADPRPNDSRRPGAWIVHYLRNALSHLESPRLDYALITHFHGDHMGAPDESSPLAAGGYRRSGITEVGNEIPIGTLLDRGWPDYDYPSKLDFDAFTNYRHFADWQVEHRGMKVEAFVAGRNDQIVLKYRPEDYPDFEVRNLTANGRVWTGRGTSTRSQIPPLESLAPEDFPSENMCSLSFRLSYGAFDFYTGGDLTGIPNVGHPEWHNMERAVAGVVGPVEVHVVNHHGSIDPASPAFLAALRPRVHIVPAWSPTHPAPVVLKRLLSERAYPGPRDVFILELREPTKAAIGPRARQVQSDAGHIVVRVPPPGDRYDVFVLDDGQENAPVLSKHGPYHSR